MIAIADSSLLIAMAAIDCFDLIQRRFPDGIYVPPSVWNEVVEQGGKRPGALKVASSSWIKVRGVKDKGLVRFLKRELDDGEAEAIALAHEVNADILLIDKRDAREAPKALILKC